jgi:topoisomerase-4 subunit A
MSQNGLEIIENKEISDFATESYRDYGDYVVKERAIPSVCDGLKPVQRRIIFSMHELGIKHTGKHKKAARTVGDVLGKFHPHGDTACYEAMVQMTQPFTFRYPLIDGQGNWGSMDNPKSFAAMRYTESRLQKFSNVLLSEINKGTVKWAPNFDGSLKEPTLLPATLPYVLLNGTTGVAVGWASDIPPHNINEIICATQQLIKNPETTLNTLLETVKGPDFPTGCNIVLSDKEKTSIYETGQGKITMDAVWHEEDGNIIIDKLPYKVSGENVLVNIAQQMNDKKLPMISDLRDESDKHNPTRLVIIPKSKKSDLKAITGHLMATTDLRCTSKVNMTVLGLNSLPKLAGLREILTDWIVFRKQTVTNRTQSRLEKVLARLHILDGLMIAFLNIDEVIEIIRGFDDAKTELMQRFGLSEIQANSILEIKLRQLAKIEEISIKAEQDELHKEKESLEEILNKPEIMNQLIIDELEKDKKEFADDRICKVITDEESAKVKAISKEDLLTSEPVTVVISKQGWIRAVKGHNANGKELSFKTGDSFSMQSNAKSNSYTFLINKEGRCFNILTSDLPSGRGLGEPITKFIKSQTMDIQHLGFVEKDEQYLLTSQKGYGFITAGENLLTNNKAGKQLINLTDTKLSSAKRLNKDSTHIASYNSAGYLLVQTIEDIPVLPKGKGNKIIQIKDGESLALVEDFNITTGLAIANSKTPSRTIKEEQLLDWEGRRASRGKRPPHGFTKEITQLQKQ